MATWSQARRQTRDAVWTTGALVLSQVIVAAIYLSAARGALPEEYGRTVAPLTVAMTVAGLVEFGSNTLIIREVAAGRMTDARFAAVFVSRGYIVAGASLLATFALVASHRPGYLSGLPLYVTTAAVAQAAIAHLRGSTQARAVAACLVGDKLVAGLVLVVLVANGSAAYLVLWLAFSAGSVASLLIALRLWRRELRASVTHACRSWRRANPWAGSLHFGLSTVVLTIQSLDVGVVLLVAGEQAAGVFSAVSRWTQPLTLIASGFTQATYPHASAASNDRAAWEQMKRGTVVLVPMAAIVLLVAAFARPIVILILGTAYLGSVSVVRLLMVGTLAVLANQPMVTFLQARGRETESLRGFVASIPLQLLTVGIGGRLWGATGAAAGLVLGQTVLFALLWTKVRAAIGPVREDRV